ncbi:LysM peptidoglycan-binding domain-containing protein [Peribacillus asahii]|uniref:LysM peptidoglycan-binding domain-containing protein n=1 Tax=Peribacillus asahii TaxID=228899 RepID=A0A398B2H4_9BACI|nr:LysM domain-containing protein [Peribacillus asahii]RID84067.1 LysM peptidoglycan-binding domain-containing protein [Peribacillus asahii]
MLIHVVTPGETLWQIASRYGVDFARLVAVNELPDSGRLVIGQALIIPRAARQHTVESGETLWNVSKLVV